MKKLHTHSGTLHRILVCLSVITLLAGQASTPTPTPQPEPPTPAEAAYEDWTQRRPTETKQGNEAVPEENAAPDSSQMFYDCQTKPHFAQYEGLVYSRLFKKGELWDEDIVFQLGICADSTDMEIKLNDNLGADFEPHVSREAKSIVFVSDRNSTSQTAITNIYTMGIYGQNQRRLTTTAAQDRMPAFSPDGKKIVFVSTRSGNGDIYVMNSDGSGQTQLTSSTYPDVEPDWSPDGKQIAWVRRTENGNGYLMVMNADGTGQRALMAAKQYAGQPRWSPSGTRLLLRFDNNADGWLDIGMVNADGSSFSFLPVYQQNRGQYSDLEVGGWVKDESGLVFNAIYYYYDENQWWLASTHMLRASFANPAYAQYASNTYYYMFTPHIQHMDITPPVSYINPLPEFSHYKNVPVRMRISDDFSKTYSYRLDASSTYEPGWKWLHGGSIWGEPRDPFVDEYLYTGIPGDTVSFRIQSTDRAANVEPAKPAPDVQTRLYQWTVKVNTVDAREKPMMGVQVQADPAAMNGAMSGEDGLASMYFATTGRYGIGYNKTGYNSAPAARWNVDGDKNFLAVLTGPNEQLINGYFDDLVPLDGWQQAGVIDTNLAAGRYGEKAARLGMICNDGFCYRPATALGAHVAETPGAEMAIDKQRRVHVRYEGTHYGVIYDSGAIVPWPDLPVQGEYGPILFTPEDAPFMMAEARFITWDGSAWVTDPAPFIQETSLRYDMDGLGRLHVLFNDLACGGCLKYTRRDTDGTWLEPRLISDKKNLIYNLAAEPDGTLHIAYDSPPLTYQRILPDGTFISTETIPSNYTVENLHMKYVTGQGLYLLYSNEWYSTRKRTPIGYWVDIENGYFPGRALDLQVDGLGNVYKYLLVNNAPVIHKLAVGNSKFQGFLSPRDIGIIYDFAVDAQASPHFLTGEGVGATFRYAHRKGVWGVTGGSGALEQQITIGEGMNEPTLSFFYRMETSATNPASAFAVTFTPTDGEPVTLFNQPVRNADWAHVWADLKPYQGMSGTLSFRLDQVDGEKPAYVYIDEASVSSYTTPFLRSVEPMPLAFPIAEGTWVDVYGGNIQQGAQVFVVGLPAAQVEWIDSGHIRFLVPNLPQPGRYLVSVVNPNSGEAQIGMYTGMLTFIPFAAR